MGKKQEQLVFTIDTDGSTTVEAQNFKGSSCKEASKEFEKALGTVEGTKKKPEFFQTSTNKDKNVLSR